MAEKSGLDAEETVLNFLERLPATDGGSLPVLILAYMNLPVPGDHTEMVGHVRAYLTNGSGFPRAGRLISVVACIDQILFAWIEGAPGLMATANMLVAREPDVDTWQQMRASIPLRAKHTERTNAEWQELRQSTLSVSAIRGYIDQVTRPGPG